MQRVASGAFDLFALIWSALFFFPFLVVALRPRPQTVRRLSRVWARGMLWGLRRIVGLDHRVAGRARRRLDGPRLLLANHQSWWETVALAALEPDVAIVAKRSLGRIPLFGWYLRRSPMILIDRAGSAAALRQMAAEARTAVADGRSVLIFPEGTRRPVGAPLALRRSVHHLYRALGLEAQPIVHDAGAFLGRGDWLKRPGVITVAYGAPIPPGLDRAAFLARLEAALGPTKDRLSAGGDPGTTQDAAQDAIQDTARDAAQDATRDATRDEINGQTPTSAPGEARGLTSHAGRTPPPDREGPP